MDGKDKVYQIKYTDTGGGMESIGPAFALRTDAEIYMVGRANYTGYPVARYKITDIVNEATQGSDAVETPEHYTRLKPQPIEVAAAWKLDFFDGSALAYIARAGHKAGEDAVKDYKKAASFLRRKVALLEGRSVLE